MEGTRKGGEEKKEWPIRRERNANGFGAWYLGRTHPSGFALILECFFGVLRGRLHVVHRMFHVVLYAIYHLALIVDRRRGANPQRNTKSVRERLLVFRSKRQGQWLNYSLSFFICHASALTPASINEGSNYRESKLLIMLILAVYTHT